MEINEDNKTVTVTKLYMHKNMMNVFDMTAAGYKVIVTAYGKPVAKIENVKMTWNGLGFVSE